MSAFTATLLPGTLLAHVHYRFYDSGMAALAAFQTSGITQNADFTSVFGIVCTVPGGAALLVVSDSTDATNYAPIALNSIRVGQSYTYTNDDTADTANVTIT